MLHDVQLSMGMILQLSTDHLGRSALHRAVEEGKYGVVAELVQQVGLAAWVREGALPTPK